MTEATPSTIPPAVVEQLKVFNDALTALEESMKPHFDVAFEQHLERSALEMARTDLMSLFSLTSIAWSLSSLRGEDPQENDKIGIELARTKQYMGRLKQIEDRKLAPRLNTTAAKNFVRNAIWELPSSSEKPNSAQESNEGEEHSPSKKSRIEDDDVVVVDEDEANETSVQPTKRAAKKTKRAVKK